MDTSDVGSVSAPIRAGTDVTEAQLFSRFTVGINDGSCTGTIIGRRHVLTAAHCGVRTGDPVTFYFGALPSADPPRTVIRVYQPAGVMGTDVTDTDGNSADFAVLQLDGTIPPAQRPAQLPTSWPGSSVTMFQVGVGLHDALPNDDARMRFRSTLTMSATTGNGLVVTRAAVNKGDSGGPLVTFANNRGVVHGAASSVFWNLALRSGYASTAFHFDRIVRALGHEQVNYIDYPGNDLPPALDTNLRDCVAVCMANPSCNAYTFVKPTTCRLKTAGVGAAFATINHVSGRKLTTGPCTSSGGICVL